MRQAAPDVEFSFDGKTWKARMDWAAIEWFEKATDSPLVDFFRSLAVRSPKSSHLARFIQASLLRHHGELDFDLCGDMTADEALVARLFELAGDSAPPQGDKPGERAAA